MATPFPPLNLLLADLARSQQSINAALREPLPCFIHTKAKCLGFDAILTTMALVIIGTGFLHGLAISVLGRSPAR